MRKYCSVVFLVALAGAGLTSCASSSPGRRKPAGPLPVATLEAARSVGLAPAQTDQALKLYTAKCVRCHKAYDPRAYTAPQWQSWMAKMSRKAHLNTEQMDLLARYLVAVRATPALENTNLNSAAEKASKATSERR